MTQPVPVPLSVVALDLAAAFADVELPPQAHAILAQLDSGGWTIEGYRIIDELEGRVVRLRLPAGVSGMITLTLPDVTAFEAAVGIGEGAEVEVREPGPFFDYAEIRNLRATLRIDPALLRPVDGGDRAELAWVGGLRVYRDGRIRLAGDPELSLSPCEIGATGVVVALDGMSLDLSSSSSVAGIRALGLPEDFQGLYARAGTVTVLPQAGFGGQRGISFSIRDLAIGSTGVTGTGAHYYELTTDNGHIEPTSPLVGSLFDERWQLGIAAAEVGVRNSVVQHFLVDGLLRIPFLDTLFDVRFGMRQVPGGYRTTAHLGSVTALQIPVAHGAFDVAGFTLDGDLDPDGFALSGGAQGIALDLDPLLVDAASAAFAISSRPTADELRLALTGVELGPLGTVEHAELVWRETVGDDGSAVTDIAVEAAVSWHDLRTRLAVPDGFPALPDDGEVTAALRWRDDDATGEHRLLLSLGADLSDVDALWPFVPEDLRPDVERFRFLFEAEYADADAFGAAPTDTALDGSVTAELQLRMPDLGVLPGGDLVSVSSDLVTARLMISVTAGEPSMSLEILDPFAVDVNLPGLAQPQPPLHAAITRIALEVGDGGTSGAFVLEGDFAISGFAPPASLAIAGPLQTLFANIDVDPPAGTARVELAFAHGAAALSMEALLTSGGLDVDVFGMIADLARGIAPPPDAASATDVAVDVDAGFDLRAVRVQLGSLDDGTDASLIAVELVLGLRFAGLTADVSFRLSDTEFVLGLPVVDIPLAVPHFPLGAGDLAGLTTDSAWRDRLDDLAAQIDARAVLPDAADDEALRQLQMQQFLLSAIYDIRRRLAGPANAHTYDGLVGLTVGVMEVATGALHIDTGLMLHLRDVQFLIPFADPRGIRLEGTAFLGGFADTDPLKALETARFTLGLSAELIYASLQSDEAIPLPDIGHYTGGSIKVSNVTIGYGYTKNSFTIILNGELRLPDALVEDLDSSDEFGIGIRLPTFNRLGFKLDLIPVVLGPVDFVVPLVEFDLDLRTPGAPALVSTAPCTPHWDGLQLIMPGVLRDGVKHLAFSPVFATMPMPNLRFDGDLMIGDERTGLTVIADDVLVLFGFLTGAGLIPIPLLAGPYEPYFDNLCVNLRIAGFGVNANLQRPFPSLSPLALFEVLGLISDPLMEIAPDGSLANTMRVSLTDALVTLPEEVLRLFPQASSVNAKPLNVTVNLGTVITAVQQVWHAVEAALDAPALLEDLDLSGLLGLLPPELRKHRLSGSFAGFDATAVLLLLDANDSAALKAEFDRRDQPPRPPVTPALSLGTAPDPGDLARYRPRLPATRGARTFHPDDPSANLFAGIEFAAFGGADVDDLLPARAPMAGVVVGAHVKVLAGQRYRFLGAVFEDGSFSLISAVDVDPLQLTVAGIRVSLPFELHGRLVLTGRAKRDGYSGAIDASGYAAWNVLPGVLRLEIASPARPAMLRLHSDGTFALRADLRVLLFDGAAALSGSVDISQTHCLVAGSFRFRAGETPGRRDVPLVDLRLAASGRVGPGATFEFSGDGSLEILGEPFSSVAAVVSDRGARIHAELHTGSWRLGAAPLDCELDLVVDGEIDLRKRTRPAFALAGSGSLRVHDARIDGAGAITARAGSLTTEVDGRLLWQGREWLGGRIRLSGNRLELSGRTAVALDLTPSRLGQLELANLFLRVDIDGTFSLDADAGLAAFTIRGDALLGARLAGDSEQVFPLAAMPFDASGSVTLDIPLAHVAGFKLLPFDTPEHVTVPVPILVPLDDPPPLKLTTRNMNDDHAGGRHRIELRWDGNRLLPVDVAGFPVPDLRSPSSFSHEIPLGWEPRIATLDLPLAAELTLSLVWHDGGLAIRAVNATGTQHWRLRTP